MLFKIVLNLLFISSICLAAGKSQPAVQNKNPNISVVFDFFLKKDSANPILTANFDGKSGDNIQADLKPVAQDLKCQISGIFQSTQIEKKPYLRAKLSFLCDQAEKKISSDVGFFLLPIKPDSDFVRKIYLNDQYPEVVLKLKSITI